MLLNQASLSNGSIFPETSQGSAAKLPYFFGNLDFDFNTSCNATPAEYSLSKQMRKSWTAMTENGNPSPDDVEWPQFEVTANGSSTPGLVIGNSTVPGLIDYSICKSWSAVNATILASNATATGTPTPSSTSTPTSGTATISGHWGFCCIKCDVDGIGGDFLISGGLFIGFNHLGNRN